MFIFRSISAAILILSLTSCLKVTGEARDPFDIDHGDQPLSLGQLNFFKAKAEEDEEVASSVLADLNKSSETTDVLVPVSATATSDASQQLNADFEKWKAERDSDSDEYQQFKEFLEYREWLEYQKAQNK